MKKPTILFFASIGFKHPLSGRPEALLRVLSKKEFKTAFVEFPSSLIGFLKSPLPQRQRIWEFLFPKPKIIENIIVIPAFPILPFGRLRVVRNINKIILGLWMRNALASLENKIAIISTPWWYQIIKYLNIKEIYYDCLDDVSAFSAAPRELKFYKELEKKLIRVSKKVFAITPTLKTHILSIDSEKKTCLLPNGVDTNWFKIETLPIPEDIRRIKKPLRGEGRGEPIAGYVGGISIQLDTELLAYCAKELKNWSFVLVGSVSLPGIERKFQGIPNIYFIGWKHYSRLPYYINAFDVCLIPIILDKWGVSSDPIKLYEYFSMGKPVVTTNIAIMKELGELVYVGEEEDSFMQKIKQAYEEKDIGIKARINYARGNTWDKRVDKLLTQIMH